MTLSTVTVAPLRMTRPLPTVVLRELKEPAAPEMVAEPRSMRSVVMVLAAVKLSWPEPRW